MATFITTKEVGESFYCSVQTLDGYWKMYHNDSYSTVFNDGEEGITITNPNREVTIIPCLSDGTPRPSTNILVLGHNMELESFNGTGLSGLTNLNLGDCGLTEFDGAPLTSLTRLTLSNNQLTTLDISNMDYLQELYVQDNLLTPSVNNSLLAKLAANELVNNWDDGAFNTTGGRTSAGTTDYNYLIANGWTVEGANLASAVRKLRVKGVGQLNQ
jgi:hypothetical protein